MWNRGGLSAVDWQKNCIRPKRFPIESRKCPYMLDTYYYITYLGAVSQKSFKIKIIIFIVINVWCAWFMENCDSDVLHHYTLFWSFAFVMTGVGRGEDFPVLQSHHADHKDLILSIFLFSNLKTYSHYRRKSEKLLNP